MNRYGTKTPCDPVEYNLHRQGYAPAGVVPVYPWWQNGSETPTGGATGQDKGKYNGNNGQFFGIGVDHGGYRYAILRTVVSMHSKS